MDIPSMSKSIRRIVVLQQDSAGNTVPVLLYRRSRSGKKGTRGFKIVERATRRMMEAQRSGADKYLSRHEKSNAKRRDGWIRDLPLNVVRAGEKMRKSLKLPVLP